MSDDNIENSSEREAEAVDSKQENLSEDLAKAKKDYLYLLAEFDNYRKNAIKERSELHKYGGERFVREFLGLYDNFERALESEVTGENWSSFRDGIALISTEMKSLLQRFGVEEVKSEGKPFDPATHEALGSEPDDKLPSGHVARVFKKAYKMHDKLIRPAQVTVSTPAQPKN